MPPARSPAIPTRARAPAAVAPPPPPAPAAHELVMFVSCVAGKPFSRLPLPGSRGGSLIGAVREGGAYKYDEDEVVGLTRAEVELHGKVYRRALGEGDLRLRYRPDWEAWQRALEQRAKMAAVEAQETPAAPAGGSGS